MSNLHDHVKHAFLVVAKETFILENKIKFFELKSRGYRDRIKKTRDKIGMGYESLHIMELLKCAVPTSQ